MTEDRDNVRSVLESWYRQAAAAVQEQGAARAIEFECARLPKRAEKPGEFGYLILAVNNGMTRDEYLRWGSARDWLARDRNALEWANRKLHRKMCRCEQTLETAEFV